MRFFSLLLLSSQLLFCLVASTLACDSVCLESSAVEFGFGYRTDQFDWSIANNTSGGTPNILSELVWDNLEISQLQLAGQFESTPIPWVQRKLFVQGDLSIGKIWSGTVRDSDYGSDDRMDELSRSLSDADNGMTFDLSGGIGPIFEFEKYPGLKVVPLVGYGFNMQALTMTNGEQVPIDGTGTRTPISGLDSSYTAYWYGPWLGGRIEYVLNQKLSFATDFAYHWVDFYAQADWNLRLDFEHPVSFEHESRGAGVVWNIDGVYSLSEKWLWLLSATVQDWNASGGTDRTFLADGSIGKTRLNHVNWNSFAVMTSLSYQF